LEIHQLIYSSVRTEVSRNRLVVKFVAAAVVAEAVAAASLAATSQQISLMAVAEHFGSRFRITPDNQYFCYPQNIGTPQTKA
jgi:hypothetical protein